MKKIPKYILQNKQLTKHIFNILRRHLKIATVYEYFKPYEEKINDIFKYSRMFSKGKSINIRNHVTAEGLWSLYNEDPEKYFSFDGLAFWTQVIKPWLLKCETKQQVDFVISSFDKNKEFRCYIHDLFSDYPCHQYYHLIKDILTTQNTYFRFYWSYYLTDEEIDSSHDMILNNDISPQFISPKIWSDNVWRKSRNKNLPVYFEKHWSNIGNWTKLRPIITENPNLDLKGDMLENFVSEHTAKQIILFSARKLRKTKSLPALMTKAYFKELHKEILFDSMKDEKIFTKPLRQAITLIRAQLNGKV